MHTSEVRSVSSLAALYAVRMLGLFMVLPVLTLAGDEYQGANVFLLGVALGIYGLTQALLQIPFGLLSDRFGRKPLIAIGLMTFAVGSLIAASAETIEWLIVGRALQGAGAIAGVIMAMVADLTSEQNRTKAMASIGASIGMAFAFSLVLGPVLMNLGGVRWIFIVTLVLSIVGLLILFLAVPKVPVAQRRVTLAWDDFQSLLTDYNLLRLNVGIFVLHAVLMALFVAVPLLLESVNIIRQYHPWVYLGLMLGSFCMMVPLIIVGERKNKLKPIFLSVLLVAAIALLSISLAAEKAMLILFSMLVFFMSFNYLEATLPSLMSKTVATDKRGAGSGLFSTSQFLGAATGGLVGGWLYQEFGLSILMLVCAFSMACWWLFAFNMVVPKQAEIATKNVVA